MVLLKDEWKLDPSCEVEVESLSTVAFGGIEKHIQERGKGFIEESYQWVKRDILNEEEFLKEEEARKNMLNLFILYERVLKRFMKDSQEKYCLLLNRTWEKIRDELNIAINEVFSVTINEKRLHKRKGESMEHYLMRCAILVYLNEKYGVRDFVEEYSKLKEVFESSVNAKAEKMDWGKIAKRADLYVHLNDGSTFWIEVERTTSSSEITKKLERLKIMLSHFPDLFDKVVFVFSSLISGMAEATLTEARVIGFPGEKFVFYEVNLRENRIIRLVNPKLTEVEFGNRMLDMIADGCGEPVKKTAREVRDIVKEMIIIPLVNKEYDDEYVISKKEKIKRLISFWRKHTKKYSFGATSDEINKSEKEVEFKKYALGKIKQHYPSLLK